MSIAGLPLVIRELIAEYVYRPCVPLSFAWPYSRVMLEMDLILRAHRDWGYSMMSTGMDKGMRDLRASLVYPRGRANTNANLRHMLDICRNLRKNGICVDMRGAKSYLMNRYDY